MTKKILFLILTISSIASICYAQTNRKISELTPLTAVVGSDVVPLNDVSTSTTKSATVSRILETVSGVDFGPANATYLTLTTNGTLSAEVAVGVTDDATLVANGATIEAKVLPSCSNATTSKLLYNSSTNAFSCGSDQNSGGGGGLGADLSSTDDNILSTTGSINFTDMTLYAESLVLSGGTMSIVDDFTVINQFIIPAIQDCSSVLQTGEVCIDGNISGMVDAMAFMGSDGYERVNIAMRKEDIVSLTDGDTFAYDDTTDGWVTIQASVPLWDGTEGTLVYPLTPATTEFIVGSNVTSTADIWLKATGAAIFNQNNADVSFNVQGDTIDYLIYTDGDQAMIGTNTPATNSILTVSGTMTIEGTLVGFVSFGTGGSLASADPCTSAGTGTVPDNSIFMTTGGLVCKCNNSGADIDTEDGTSCF